MESLKQISRQQLGKVPLLYHFLWKAKAKLSATTHLKVVTVKEATEYILDWVKQIPNNYDCVIGIPRSGLWVASVLALKFGKPLSTPNAFMQGEVWQSLHVKRQDVRSILLVEDDVIYGKQILKAKQQLEQFDSSLRIDTASLFATSKGRKLIDYCYQIRNPPLLYEWVLLTNMAELGKLAVDMDGVLCEECPVGYDADEEKYAKWLETAKPYMIPQYPVEAVVTSRLEKYRVQTEIWLQKHNVKYNVLCMLQLPSKQDRTLENIIEHKVKVLNVVKPFWYWESNMVEAEAIKSKAHLPTLCVGNMMLLL